ncbi:MAG: translocation/assembly module TamB domain-containing protein [bacterium]
MRYLWTLLLILLPCTAMAQQSDKDFLTNFLEENLSGAGRAVTITGFAGALSSRATMQEMTIADDQGIWLTVKDVTLDWSRSSLLAGKVVINEFSAGEIDLARMPIADPNAMPSPEAKGFKLPDIPVSIEIQTIAAKHIILGTPVLGQAVEGELTASLQLANGEGKAALDLTRTDDGPEGHFTLNADFVAATNQLNLDLSVKEGANGVAVALLGVPGKPSAELTIKGSGPIGDFAAGISLKTDDVARLAGQVTMFPADGGRGFKADLSGDPTPVFLPAYTEFFGPDVALHLAGEKFDDGRVELSKFEVTTKAMTLNGLLNLDATGVPEGFSLTGKIGLPDGAVTLPTTSGQETRLQSADLTLNYSRKAGEIWQGKIELAGLDHPALTAGRVTLSGSGHITNAADGPTFDGKIDFVAADVSPTSPGLAAALGSDLTGTVTLDWHSGGTLGVSDLSLSGDGFKLATTGSIGGIGDGFTLKGNASGEYADLSRLTQLIGRPLKGRTTFDLSGSGGLLTGFADIMGTLRGSDLGVGVPQVDGLLAGDSALKISILRDAQGTELRSLDITANALTANVSGQISSAAVAVSGDVAFTDLSVLGPGYGGSLQGKASVNGPFATAVATLDAKGSDLAVGQAQVDGLLRGDSHVVLQVARLEDGAVIDRANITANAFAANVSGKIFTKTLSLSGDVSFTDLSVLGPGYRGALQGQASVEGPLATAVATLDAKGSNLAIGQAQVDGLLRGESTVVLHVTRDAGGAVIDRADLTLSAGSVEASGHVGLTGNDVNAKLALTNLAALNLGLSGAVDGQVHFTGQPTAGALTISAKSSALAVGQTVADTLLRGASQLEAALDLTPDGIGIKSLTLTNPQLDVTATGTATGTERNVDFDARLSDLGLLYPQFPGALVAKGTAVQNAQGYVLSLNAKGPGQIDASVNGTLDNNFRQANLAITGTANAGLANKIAAPRSLGGPLRFDLRLNGPLSLNSISGSVGLTGGLLADPNQNFGLRAIDLKLQLNNGNGQIALTGTVTSGGRVAVNGSIGVTAPYPADLAIKLTNVRLRDPELYTTTLNGALTFKGPATGGAQIAGTIALDRTELRIPSTGFNGDTTLEDLMHLNEPASSRATRVRAGLINNDGGSASAKSGFGLDLRISAPNQVFIRGRGLDAELGGSLVLRGTTNAIVPSGAFNLIRGRLDILGRRLNLSQALMQLQGALIPYIRIVASVQSEGITANVVIEGQADDPTVTFSSSPDLPQEEVLARLLFDRSLDTLTAFQAIQLASAVATLAGKGGEGVIGNLRKKAGLDNLDVTTDSTGAASLTVGKYLSEKVYTEAQVGQSGDSSISLNLDVAPHITLKGHVDSDGQTGIGIFLQRDY